MNPVLTDEERDKIRSEFLTTKLGFDHGFRKAASEIERLTSERMMEMVCPWCGSAALPATNCCDEQGRQRSGRITRAQFEYLRREEER